MNSENESVKESNSSKDPTIYYRIAGNATMLLLIIRNVIVIDRAMKEKLPNHPELQEFVDFGPRYATVWNMVIQVVYANLALACDVTQLMNKEHLVPQGVRQFRYTLFVSLFYPVGMNVAATFWPLYLYDRETVYPKKADLIMTFFDNITSHGLVSVYALYELVVIPRKSIKNVNPYRYTIYYGIIYIIVLFYTKYGDLGMWPYQVFNTLDGTPGFYLMLAYPLISAAIFYTTMCYIQDLIWKIRDSLRVNVKSD